MSGISAKAIYNPENKRGYNGNELQNKEFSNGSGLELYDFNARTYDQQIGRFIQQDPMADKEGQETLSPYHFGSNNPIRYNDSDGKCPTCPQISAQGLIGQLWRSTGTTSATVRKVEDAVNGALKDAQPYAEKAVMGFKYAGIAAGILAGGPVGIILGIPTLGLNIVKDVAKAKNSNNPKVDAMPTGTGEAIGMVGDKVSQAMGVKTSGLLQDLGGLVETVMNGTKDITQIPANVPDVVIAFDKVKVITDTYDGAEKVVKKGVQLIEKQEKDK